MRCIPALPLIALVCAAPAMAQDAETQLDDNDTRAQTDGTISADGEIVVTAGRLPGQLDVPQTPLVELDEADIAAYGVGSIADLIAQLEPATGSARGRGGGGRPVFLINGIRVSSFREFFSYPPEALRKVEVLPEEVAQRFGFPPDRRVINLILKDNYSSREVELEFEQPAQGGYFRTEQEFTWLKINGSGRVNVNVERSDRSILTEDERDIIQTTGSVPTIAGDPDPATGRSLVSDFEQYEGTINYAKAFIDSGSTLSLSGNFETSDTLSLSGFDSVILSDAAGNSELRTFGDPLERRTQTDSFNTSLGYSRPLGDFQLTATASAAIVDSATEIDQRADTTVVEAQALAGTLALDGSLAGLGSPGFDTAETKTYTAGTKVTLRGNPVLLPAGELSLTFNGGYGWNRIESADTRSATDTRLTRGVIEGGVNVGIPLTSRRENALGAIGDFSLNLQAGFDNLSDFGTLYDWTAGLIWKPVDDLQFGVTYVDNEVAPSLAFLGDPVVQTFNVPVFDFQNNTTSLVTITSGGNPNLVAEKQRDWKFTANWKLPVGSDIRLNLDYVRNRSEDVSRGFPALTDATEAAFPGRVTRAADGTLLAIDRRPVTFAETRANRLAIGLTMRGSIGGGNDARRGRGGPPPGVSRGGGRPGAGGPPPGASQPSGNAASSPPVNTQGPRRGRPGGGGFDPARFQQMREKFCATPEGEAPDLTGIPERMLERLRGPDGQIDPERLKQARERLCGEQASQQQNDRFAAIRTALCADPPKIDELPERMQARLRDEDGSINQERLTQMRERICSIEGTANSQQEQGGQQARRGGGGPGFNPFNRRGRSGFRYFLNLTHTIELDNTVLVAPGGPLLDQLDGDSTSTFGVPTNSTRLEAGLFGGGYGMRLSGRYTGTAKVNGSGAPGSTDLFVDDLATFDLRVFADLGEVLKKDKGFFKNFRISLRADNVFDGRRIVRDANGDIQLGFQPDLIDPTGRYIGIDLRKLF